MSEGEDLEERLDGADLIALERKRQVEEEGWTPEHDAEHLRGELATAGACYALLLSRWSDSSVLDQRLLWKLWPWDLEWFKPADYPDPPYGPNVHRDKHVKNLVRAGALIAAEIDVLLTPKKVHPRTVPE